MSEASTYDALWRETLTTTEAANLLSLLPHRFRQLAEERGYESLNGRWAIEDVKAIAWRLMAYGDEGEQEAAQRPQGGHLLDDRRHTPSRGRLLRPPAPGV